jgi:hypothetical protein
MPTRNSIRFSGATPALPLDEAALHLDRATDCVDDAPELDDRAVARALDDAAVMGGDRRIDQIAAQPPQARERAILVRSREPAISDDIGDKDRRELPGLAHSRPPG